MESSSLPLCVLGHMIRTESLGHRLGCNVTSADTSPPSLFFGGSDDDDCTRPTQQLVRTDVWEPQTHWCWTWVENGVHLAAEACLSVWWGLLHPQQSDGIASKKRTRSWQVNWNHHWCYLFSNVPRLTGDILFGTHPKGGRGAQRFSAPSHSDSRLVLTPKQWGSLETCSGICHNPAPRRGKHKFTQLLVYTHPDLSTCLSPTSASASTQEIVCPTPIRAKKKVRLRLDFFFFTLDKCHQKFNLWKESVLQMPEDQHPVCVIQTWQE